jgi:superfamily II DNA/RNA helicase
MDHLERRTLNLGRMSYFVLDEADEMLDQGFGPAVEKIIRQMPTEGPRRQNALFSATLPEWARAVAARLLHDPAEVRVDDGIPAGVAPESVEHILYDVPEGMKGSVLRALLGEPATADSPTLVFGRTRHGVRKLAKQLAREGYRAAALQSDLAQNARDRVIAAFRTNEMPILVATNVAARGLDIAELGRVINFDLPENGSLFTHRVGRTGRMGRAGEAITLLAPEDEKKWRQLAKELAAAGLTRALPRRPWTGPLPPVPSSSAFDQASDREPPRRSGATFGRGGPTTFSSTSSAAPGTSGTFGTSGTSGSYGGGGRGRYATAPRPRRWPPRPATPGQRNGY